MKTIDVSMFLSHNGYNIKLQHNSNIRVISQLCEPEVTELLFNIIDTVSVNCHLIIKSNNDYAKHIIENINLINDASYKTKKGELYKNWRLLKKIHSKIKYKNIQLSLSNETYDFESPIIENRDTRYVQKQA